MKRVLSMVLSLLMIVSIIPLGTLTASAASLDSRVEAAIQWAVSIANDDSHGYSQSSRNGPNYDCSSFVSTAFKNGGFSVSGSLNTSSMANAFVNVGFTKYKKGDVAIQRGDILLKPGSHVELYLGDNTCVAAHNDYDGVSGDGNGKEIQVRTKNYCTFCKQANYTYILRYNGSTTSYTYSFNFNANGGSLGSTGAFTTSYGQEFQILNTTCTRSGYTWAGWNVKRNNDNKWYVAGRGWCTESEISSNSYSKKVYSNYQTCKLDDSWTNGISGNGSYTFYAVWIQERDTRFYMYTSPFGQDCDHLTALNNKTTSGYAQERIYIWFILFDMNTGALMNTYISRDYTVDVSVYDPNGDLVYETTYNDSDANWIYITPQMSGDYVANAKYVCGSVEVSISTTYSVSYDAELVSSNSSLSLNLNGTNAKTSTITVSGNHPGEYFMRYAWDDTSVASASWGEWNGSSIPITVTGKKVGSTNLIISLYEDYTEEQRKLTSITIPVTVTANTYTITYNANGGTGAPSSQTKYYGTDITLSSTVPTRSGYTFLGWSTSSAATSATYQPGSTFSTNANTTLYAVWKANPTYSITYNANGGSGAPSTQTGSTNYTISSTVPVRFGYTFLGWSTNSSATTSTYEAGDTVAISGNLTLYAVWKSATTLSLNTSYTARIDFANQEVYYAFTPSSSGTYTFESTGSLDSKIYVYNTSGTELGNDDDSSDEGYNFKLTMSLTGGTKYFVKVRAYSNDTGTISFRTTGKYTVTYNANGGSNAPANQTKTHGTTLTLSTAVPSRSGYTFKGWATSSTATTAAYQPGGTYTFNSNVTLYAVWETAAAALTVDSHNNAVISSQADVQYFTYTPSQSGDYVIYSTSSEDTFVLLYYYSGSYITSDDNSGEGNNFRLSIYLNAGVTYQFCVGYSETTKTGTIPFAFGRVYRVSYDSNGSSETLISQGKPFGIPITLSGGPSRSGYNFLGWSASPSATSATYQPGSQYTADADITLYAVWEPLPTALSVNSSNNAVIAEGGEMKYYT